MHRELTAEALSPTGEAMRARAEGILERRHKVLLDRSGRRALTQAERREYIDLERILADLRRL